MQLSEQQLSAINSAGQAKLLLSGPAGSGKTTAAQLALQKMLRDGIPAESILVLTPQRSLAQPYREIARSADFPSGGALSVVTMGGLAQRMVALFWPMVALLAGFKHPNQPPNFLTLETAQYYMAQLIEPLMQIGYFDSVTIDPNRAYSQILDNLNKAAVVGFKIDDIAERLKSAWTGRSKQMLAYDQVQECGMRFREYCLANNLLDFSLQYEVFARHLWPSTLCRNYLSGTYQHLIYDNIEEDVPLTHDIVLDWLPQLKSALIVQDDDAGFRTFLGADPTSASRLKNDCQILQFTGSFVQSEPVKQFTSLLSTSIIEHKGKKTNNSEVLAAFSVHPFRFYPQSMDWIVERIKELVIEKGVSPSEIVVLTPFLSDSLRFALSQRFDEAALPFSTFRPSRSLQDEPVVNAMLTLAKLAHPEWKLVPTRHDLRYMLMQVIPDLDLIRADLLSQIMYSPNRVENQFSSFAQINSQMQERITFVAGNRFETLRLWLEDPINASKEMDIFFSRLFGALLTTSDFGFSQNLQAASVVNRLIESARKFRQAVLLSDLPAGTSLGKEYVQMVEQGVISAQYLTNWEEQQLSESVLIAPAFTYLMSNRPVKYQFWQDVGSSGWWARLDQPLTQPYILSRNWQPGKKWSTLDDLNSNQDTLNRVCVGLLRRCSEHVYLLSVSLNESGNEERGKLLIAIQSVLRNLPAAEVTNV